MTLLAEIFSLKSLANARSFAFRDSFLSFRARQYLKNRDKYYIIKTVCFWRRRGISDHRLRKQTVREFRRENKWRTIKRNV